MRTFILSEYRKYGKIALIERVRTPPEEPTAYRVTVCKRYPNLKNAMDVYLKELPNKDKEAHQKQIKDTLNRYFDNEESQP